VTESELRERLDELFDRHLLFHGFTAYMRDYELVVYESVDPRSGLAPRHLRFLFRFCTEAEVHSRLAPKVWASSTDDQLLRTHDVTRESTGYAWGVEAQELYPGATIAENSNRARSWREKVGLSFYEVRIEANAHVIHLVFSDLVVTEVTEGYRPHEVKRDGHSEQYASGCTIPLGPDGADQMPRAGTVGSTD